MEDIWNRIESWLMVNAPDILNDLLPGATEEEIFSAQEHMSINFPEDVKTSYLIHNGQLGMSDPLMGEWQLLSLKDIQIQWDGLKELFDAGQFANVQSEPIGRVQADWWNIKWIPLAYNGAGDLYCLDLEPASGGEVGQIISYLHIEEERECVADNFLSWLNGFANDLEVGKYTVVDGELLISE